MSRVTATFTWDKDTETLFIQRSNLRDPIAKGYNHITTPGEVGTAVKDFMMELEANDKNRVH